MSIGQDRVDEIFYRASQVPPEDRPAFLDGACDGPEQRREVEALLASNDDMSDTFLETPVLPRAADGGPPEQDHFGAYRIKEEIGRGGMGRVYLAVRDDDEYEQEVAIKILKRGLDTEEVVRRFRDERQILARLDHPYIAKLLDGGTTSDDLPYLVMERVQGERIDRYCETHRLPVRAHLELFRKVCAAVHFAHQNLVVHRDLKPGNILITEGGDPRLLDFGIAKLLDPGEASQTVPGNNPMTPGYASPEKANGGPITTASDVYSLGCLFYELLTGRRPHQQEGDARPPLRGWAGEQEPEWPSRAVDASRAGAARRLRRRLAGDLDSIVLKALENDPARRYASVEQLSEDIGRHLNGLPVVARRPTVIYRIGKFVRRHRVAVALASAVLLMIVGFTINTLVLKDRAVLERQQAERQQRLADELRRLLLDVFQKPSGSSGEEVTARELLEAKVATLDEELQNQPEARAEHLRARGGREHLHSGGHQTIANAARSYRWPPPYRLR